MESISDLGKGLIYILINMEMVNSYTSIRWFMGQTGFSWSKAKELEGIHKFSNCSLHILEEKKYMNHNVNYSGWVRNGELFYIFYGYTPYHECDFLLAKHKPENLHPYIQNKIKYLGHVDKIKSDKKVYKLSEKWEVYRIV